MVRIGFGTNERPHSRLIRWATDSRWSHTWIEYESELWGGLWAAHSTPRGIVKTPLSRVVVNYPVHVRFACNHDLRDGFEWAREYIGSPYDYGVIWNGLLNVVYRTTNMKWLYNIVSRNNSKYTCSEFVTAFLKASNVPLVSDLDPELTSPGTLYETCVQAKDFEFV